MEIDEPALDTGMLNFIRIFNSAPREQTFKDEQLEDTEGTKGTEYKRIWGTGFLYSKLLKLIVDPETKVPLNQLDDVKLYRVINYTKGANLLISFSP